MWIKDTRIEYLNFGWVAQEKGQWHEEPHPALCSQAAAAWCPQLCQHDLDCGVSPGGWGLHYMPSPGMFKTYHSTINSVKGLVISDWTSNLLNFLVTRWPWPRKYILSVVPAYPVCWILILTHIIVLALLDHQPQHIQLPGPLQLLFHPPHPQTFLYLPCLFLWILWRRELHAWKTSFKLVSYIAWQHFYMK